MRSLRPVWAWSPDVLLCHGTPRQDDEHFLETPRQGALVLATLVVLSLARGLSSVATKDVLGKTIAKQRRGTLMGWSGSLAGGATLLAGAILMLFDERPGELALAILLVVAALVCVAAIGLGLADPRDTRLALKQMTIKFPAGTTREQATAKTSTVQCSPIKLSTSRSQISRTDGQPR